MVVETHQENRFLLFEPTVGLFEVSMVNSAEFRVRRLPRSELAVVADFLKLLNGGLAHRTIVAPGSDAQWWRSILAGQQAPPDPTESSPVAGLIVGPAPVSADAIPDELSGHLRRLGVEEDARNVLQTVGAIYPDAERVELSLWREESGDERVRINAVVTASGNEETERYFRCLGQWTAAVSPTAADKIILHHRLSHGPTHVSGVATVLAHKDGPSAAELRTAVSRAYYGVYNTAVEFLSACKVAAIDNQAGHRFVPSALRACGDADLRAVAAALDALRLARWEADYAMSAAGPEHAGTVKKHVGHAKQAVRLIDACQQDAERFGSARSAVRRWAATA